MNQTVAPKKIKTVENMEDCVTEPNKNENSKIYIESQLEIVNGDIKSFQDPSTFEEFEEPVVDECGHTFERTTMSTLKAICPMNNQPIDINNVRPNFNLIGAQAEVKEVKKAYNNILTQLIKTHQKQLEINQKQLEVNQKQLEAYEKRLEANQKQFQEMQAEHRFVLENKTNFKEPEKVDDNFLIIEAYKKLEKTQETFDKKLQTYDEQRKKDWEAHKKEIKQIWKNCKKTLKENAEKRETLKTTLKQSLDISNSIVIKDDLITPVNVENNEKETAFTRLLAIIRKVYFFLRDQICSFWQNIRGLS